MTVMQGYNNGIRTSQLAKSCLNRLLSPIRRLLSIGSEAGPFPVRSLSEDIVSRSRHLND